MTGIERYPNLFKPIRLGNTYFRNRIFSAPAGLLDLDAHKSPSMDYIAYWERKAKGGAASINVVSALFSITMQVRADMSSSA